MKKGFTLIELLVVMVIIALLVGLLLPALARAKEEARKTQCRSNMKQIGLGIMMYANDNGGYTPEISGGMFIDANVANKLRHPWEITYLLSKSTALAAPYDTLGGVASNSVTMGQPQWWQTSPSQPARSTGLGHLWASGYLTSKGAQILYCPSNNNSRLLKENRVDKKFKYDQDEPFWTSSGQVIRANNNMIGEWNYSGSIYGRQGCYDGTSALDRGYCYVIVNYSMRFPKIALIVNTSAQRPQSASVVGALYPMSYKLEELGALGIVADHTEPFLSQSRFQAGDNNWAPDYPELYEKVTKYVAQNHDASWNVLFTDGSVKTYSDGAKNVIKAMCTFWKGATYNFPEEAAPKMAGGNPGWEDYRIWTPYFDRAYQGD